MQGLGLVLGCALVLAVGCGGDTDGGSTATGGSGGTTGGSGGAQGGSGGTTGGSGGATGGTGGTVGGAGGATGGAAGSSGAAGSNTGGTGNVGGGTGTPCDPGQVQCDGPVPNCPEGQVPSVQGGCWGACVPILDCAPVPSCANCQGFCAAYAGFTTEYRCVMPSITCAALACVCLAKYFCVDPYNACDDQGGPNDPPITCACPAC